METKSQQSRLDAHEEQILQLQSDVAEIKSVLTSLAADRVEEREFRKFVLNWMKQQGTQPSEGTSGVFDFSSTSPASPVVLGEIVPDCSDMPPSNDKEDVLLISKQEGMNEKLTNQCILHLAGMNPNSRILGAEKASTNGDNHWYLVEFKVGVERKETLNPAMNPLDNLTSPPPPLLLPPPPPPPLPPEIDEKNRRMRKRLMTEYKQSVSQRLFPLIKVTEGFLGCHKNRVKTKFGPEITHMGSWKFDQMDFFMKAKEKFGPDPDEPYNPKLVQSLTYPSSHMTPRATSTYHEKSAITEAPYAFMVVYSLLVNVLQNRYHRLSILHIELDFSKFIQNSEQRQFKFHYMYMLKPICSYTNTLGEPLTHVLPITDYEENGLIFCCGQQLDHVHNCPEGKISVLLAGSVEAGTAEGGNCNPESIVQEEDQILRGITAVLTLSGVFFDVASEDKTLKIEGAISGMEMVILIDSSTTCNFFSQQLVISLGLFSHFFMGINIKWGDGRKVFISICCIHRKVSVGPCEFLINALVMEVGYLDMILGIKRLKTLGEVIHNWDKLSMFFMYQGHFVLLLGMTTFQSSEASLKNQLSLLVTSHVLSPVLLLVHNWDKSGACVVYQGTSLQVQGWDTTVSLYSRQLQELQFQYMAKFITIFFVWEVIRHLVDLIHWLSNFILWANLGTGFTFNQYTAKFKFESGYDLNTLLVAQHVWDRVRVQAMREEWQTRYDILKPSKVAQWYILWTEGIGVNTKRVEMLTIEKQILGTSLEDKTFSDGGSSDRNPESLAQTPLNLELYKFILEGPKGQFGKSG